VKRTSFRPPRLKSAPTVPSRDFCAKRAGCERRDRVTSLLAHDESNELACRKLHLPRRE
jgi:hypothetical protein